MKSTEKIAYNLPPTEYKGYLDRINEDFIAACREKIRYIGSILDDYNVCVISVGSDGKRERHPQSKTELVYIQDKGSELPLDPKLIVNEFNKKSGKDYKSLFDTGNYFLPSVFKIGTDTLSFALHNPRLIFPDIVLNSTYISGNYDVFLEARKVVATELALTTGLSGKIRKELKNQLRNYKKNIMSGQSRGVVCFDELNQYYDERNNPGKYGFKHAFLRTTQRFLDIKTQENIHGGNIDVNQIETLPVNTVERIKYFGFDQNLSEAYLWFLQQYHCIQEEYKSRRDLVKIPYDRDLLEANKEIVLRCCIS